MDTTVIRQLPSSVIPTAHGTKAEDRMYSVHVGSKAFDSFLHSK